MANHVVYIPKKTFSPKDQAGFEAKRLFMVRFVTYKCLHLLNCTFTISVVKPEKASYIYDDRPL